MAKLDLGDIVNIDGEVIEFKKTGRKTLYTIKVKIRKYDPEKPERPEGVAYLDVYDTDFKKSRKKK